MASHRLRNFPLPVPGEELREARQWLPRGSDISERERIMGFDEGYTLGAMASSAAKAQPAEELAIRASMLGNANDVKVAAWALSHLAFDLGYLERVPTRAEIRN